MADAIKSGYQYNEVGLWDPYADMLDMTQPPSIKPVPLKGLSGVSQNGFSYTLGFGYDLWTLCVKKDTSPGSAPSLNFVVSDTAGYKNDGNFSPFLRSAFAVQLDSGNVGVLSIPDLMKKWYFLGLRHVLGEKVESRINLGMQGSCGDGMDGFNLGRNTNSISVALTDPLKLPKFSLIKKFNVTFAYLGVSRGNGFSDGFWARRFDVVMSNKKKTKDVIVSYKQYPGSEDRVDITLCSKDLSVTAEVTPGVKNGPCPGKPDLGAAIMATIADAKSKKWASKLEAGIAADNIVQDVVYNGYSWPNTRIIAKWTADWLGIRIGVNFLWNIVKGGRREGINDKKSIVLSRQVESWTDISAKPSGGETQSTKIVVTEIAEPILGFEGKAKLRISADQIQYMLRDKVPGGVGEGAVTAPRPGDYVARDALYIKSVKLIDTLTKDRKVYGLSQNGQFAALEGPHPTTAPELSGYASGGTYEFEFPVEMYEHGRLKYRVEVEWDVNTDPKKIDNLALKKRASNGAIIRDPSAGVMDTYYNYVRWDAQNFNGTDWPAHNAARTELDLADPYDPGQPYDIDLNPYAVGTKWIIPPVLSVEVVGG